MISLSTLYLVAMVALPPLLLLSLPILATEKLVTLKANPVKYTEIKRRN